MTKKEIDALEALGKMFAEQYEEAYTDDEIDDKKLCYRLGKLKAYNLIYKTMLEIKCDEMNIEIMED